jgi:PadR family transcriptional regulator PadR
VSGPPESAPPASGARATVARGIFLHDISRVDILADVSDAPAAGRASFLVLLALRRGAKHGYEIASWIEESSQGFFTLSFGALYPVLHRLEKQGLLAAEWQAVAEAGVKRKKVYALTAAGRKALDAERAHYEAWTGAFARLMEQR